MELVKQAEQLATDALERADLVKSLLQDRLDGVMTAGQIERISFFIDADLKETLSIVNSYIDKRISSLQAENSTK